MSVRIGARHHGGACGASGLSRVSQRKREVVVPWTMIPVIKLYQLWPGLVEWGMARAMKNSR
jgi:hypothetical protein